MLDALYKFLGLDSFGFTIDLSVLTGEQQSIIFMTFIIVGSVMGLYILVCFFKFILALLNKS